MDAETIKLYLSYSKPEVPPDEIARRTEEKRQIFGGLLEEHALLMLVASDLEVPIDIPREEVVLKLKEIIEGLRTVQVTAEIKEVGEAREFLKEDNSTGMIQKIRLADDTGEINLILWTEKIGLAAGLKAGNRVQVTGAYTSKNRFDELELILGRRGKIAVLN
jgi:ssDNA-binding replication factor A large subunit